MGGRGAAGGGGKGGAGGGGTKPTLTPREEIDAEIDKIQARMTVLKKEGRATSPTFRRYRTKLKDLLQKRKELRP